MRTAHTAIGSRPARYELQYYYEDGVGSAIRTRGSLWDNRLAVYRLTRLGYPHLVTAYGFTILKVWIKGNPALSRPGAVGGRPLRQKPSPSLRRIRSLRPSAEASGPRPGDPAVPPAGRCGRQSCGIWMPPGKVLRWVFIHPALRHQFPCGGRGKRRYHNRYILNRYTRDARCGIRRNICLVWPAVRDGEPRSPPSGVTSRVLTFDATNVPLDGHSECAV